MRNTRTLSGKEVLARMRRGDLPGSSGGSKAVFDDGSWVSGPVMHKLVKAGLVDRPQGGSMSSPFTLAEKASETAEPGDWDNQLPTGEQR